MNTKALWITIIAVVVIGILIYKGGMAPQVPVEITPVVVDDTGMAPTEPMGKLPAGSAAPGDAKALLGTWVWQKTTMGKSVVLPKKPGVFAVTFAADGNVSGKTDCNGFGGDYKQGSDGILSVGPLMSTMMYCEGSQENEFTAAFGKTNSYAFDASGNLVISFDNGAGSMSFAKQ